MILFFVRGEVDSDKLIRFCYSQYRDLVGGLTSLPEQIGIIRDGGKPKLSSDGVYFNLSHSHGIVMLGMSSTEIGVDLEKIRPVDYKKFKFIDADDEDEFFEKWTERESYLKYTGEGLSALKCVVPPTAHFEHFEPFSGYHACVCAEEQSIIAYELAKEAIE